MCTLTFVPTEDGYLVGMNRDELLTRPKAISPKTFKKDGLEITCPQEPSGGTWIACNSHGNLLALLNWNDRMSFYQGEKPRSRGLLIPRLIGEPDLIATDSQFNHLNLGGVFPFRLVGIFRSERIIHEWRWDGDAKRKQQYSWNRKHWFSSSLSDSIAKKMRGGVCEGAAGELAAESCGWLRGLHRSHVPKPGPFSICVHRQDAATVSYTEVRCQGSSVSMDYLDGNPCLARSADRLRSLTLTVPVTATNLPELQV
jgi:hypothetical protein